MKKGDLMDEESTPAEETQDASEAEVIALTNLISQLGDFETAHDVGAIDDDEYIETKAKKLAFTAAIAAYQAGEEPDMDELLDQMRGKAVEPTQTEINTANIDFLMMDGGGE